MVESKPWSIHCTLPSVSVSAAEFVLFFFNDSATTEIYTLSLHDALPILAHHDGPARAQRARGGHRPVRLERSEEHTSELQSRRDLVCRLLLEKKNSSEFELFVFIGPIYCKASCEAWTAQPPVVPDVEQTW